MHEEDEEDEYEEPTGKMPQNNEGHMSQQEVAEVLGMSRSRVSEVEKKALRKFKYYLLKKYKEEDL
jgi:predicted XRE-type DNA-binding protein